MEQTINHPRVARTTRLVIALILALVPLVLVTALLAEQAGAYRARPENSLIPAEGTPPGVTSTASAPAVTSPSTRPTTPPSPGEDKPWLPEWIRQLMSREAASPSAGLVVTLTAETGEQDKTSLYIGKTVTYFITLDNQSPDTLTNIIVAVLPGDTLLSDTITSTRPFSRSIDPDKAVQGLGGTIIISGALRMISWVTPSLPSYINDTWSFSAQVEGRAEGTELTQRVYVSYKQGDNDKSATSAPVDLVMHVPWQAGSIISSVPIWFSEEGGGAFSQDWGDFDRDGDLDLVLGTSWQGVSVYRNDGGQLNHIWTSPPDPQHSQVYGVRWGDFVPDLQHRLEIVAVGNRTGINYIYRYDPTLGEFVESSHFTSTHQLFRVDVGDYDSNGAIDLVVSTNQVDDSADCLVHFYRNNGTGQFDPNQKICLSDQIGGLYENAIALSSADYDGDGDLDLAMDVHDNSLRVLINTTQGQPSSGNPFSIIPITLDSQGTFYDARWGDYNQDGSLDLVAQYHWWYRTPYQSRIYQQQKNSPAFLGSPTSIITMSDATLALDWGDWNADGRLELVVADHPPKIYQYITATSTWSDSVSLALVSGRIWGIRGVDINSQNSLDIMMATQDWPSRLYATLPRKLKPNLEPIGSESQYIPPAGSVAWGDADGDGDLDLLLGAGPPSLGTGLPPESLNSWLYINKKGSFTSTTPSQLAASGFGPHIVAFGDVDGDGKLDIAVGTPSKIQIYLNGSLASPDLDLDVDSPVRSLAWGNANDDGRLDLLVGHESGGVELYLNQGGQITTTPAFTLALGQAVSSLAWGDWDNDHYLDFAVATDGGPVRVYASTGEVGQNRAQFDRAWWSDPRTLPTRALAWADYNRDGYLDLAVGSYEEPDTLWENKLGSTGRTLGSTPAFTLPSEYTRTLSLAWGDWDNDGYPDLAVGKENGPVIVYSNPSSQPGSPYLFEAWQSSETITTTGVAWGDRDGDGDLDLAVSRKDSNQSGFYENTLVAPVHLDPGAVFTRPLPNNPPYVHVQRLGTTSDAYFYSSPEILGMPNITETANPYLAPQTLMGSEDGKVTITYKLYDPESTEVVTTAFEYSLDGGSVWHRAAPATSTEPITMTSPTGVPGTFIWDARKDVAVSDNARFRVRVVAGDRYGPVYRASGSAISPPFRVRALDCFWPTGVSISRTENITFFVQTVFFTAEVAYGSGPLKAEWDFGDGTTVVPGWNVEHNYADNGIYTVTLKVTGPACPTARPGYARSIIKVGDGIPCKKTFMPIVAKGSSVSSVAAAPDAVLPKPPSAKDRPGRSR